MKMHAHARRIHARVMNLRTYVAISHACRLSIKVGMATTYLFLGNVMEYIYIYIYIYISVLRLLKFSLLRSTYVRMRIAIAS